MLIQNIPLSRDVLPCPAALLPEDAVFFDIETTGLSHRTSHLFMIGAICWKQGQPWLTQWFLQKPSEEKEVLERFSELLKTCRTVIHYNGRSFDLPYLQDRCRYWDLPDPFAGSLPESLDLYRRLRPLRSVFSLSSLKQKDIERLLHYSRRDQLSGKELIAVYHEYLQHAGERERELLLLHNREDLLGMLSIYRFCSALDSLLQHPSITDTVFQNETLRIELNAETEFPAELQVKTSEADLLIRNNLVQISVHGVRGCFRHYYSNYKDYYYLPLEDTAIHKSVGTYVDPSFRKKATADTCFTKKEGLFFFQPSPIFLPDFHRESRKDPSCFSAEQPGKQPELLPAYVSALLSFILRC